jgi:type I restriction enzyme S subunit
MAVEKLITKHIDTWTSALQTRSTAGRGSNGKIDLYGIKKLRELILELAVRGKLVPQDPNDEPASELLKRIAAEKAELVKQGKIKKQKPLPEISEEEKPFELPVGWEWATLSHLGSFSGGKTPSKMRSEYWGGNIPWVTPKDMKTHLINTSEDCVTDFAISDGLAKVSPGSLLFVARSGILRRKFPVAITSVECTVNQDLKVLAPFIANIENYILLMMNGFERYIIKNLTKVGTTVESLLFDEFSSHPFMIPPLEEQFRITNKVNELMSLCDQLEQQSLTSLDAHSQLVETLLATLIDSQNAEESAENWARISQHFETLFTTEASIDTFKQTILQLAVMGKLVPQDPNDEPASELLKRIEQEKAQLVKEGKIKKQKPLPPVSDEEKRFVLPMGWEWCRLGDLALGSEAGWSPQCESHPRNGDDWGVLKISAVTWGEFNAEENKALPVKLEPKQEYEVKGNDFLLSRANTSELVARSVVVPQTVPKHLMLSDKIIRFQFPDLIDVNYINIVNNSMLSREYYGIVAGGTSASMKNVTRNQVSLLPVALPPYNEKKKIISVIESVLVLVDALKNLVVKSEGIKKNLTDSIIFHFEN